jgi:hypothetical protein
MLATVVEGEVDLADIFFLIAVILATIATLVHYRPLSIPGALTAAAIAFLAAGLLVL